MAEEYILLSQNLSEGKRMQILIRSILVVLLSYSLLIASGELYINAEKYTNFMAVESIIDGWSLTAFAHNPSQLVFHGKEKQLQLQYELQSLKQEFYNPGINDKIHTLALWDRNLFPNFDFGVLLVHNKSYDPYMDDDSNVFKSITLSSSYKEIVSLGVTYNHLLNEGRSAYYNRSFNVGVTGQYVIPLNENIQLKPIGVLSLTNWLNREKSGPDPSGSISVANGLNWALGVDSKLGKWVRIKHSFEFQKFGAARFFNQSINLTPFFTLFHKWGRNTKFIYDPFSSNYESEAPSEVWSGFSCQFNLQKFQSQFDIKRVPKRFNLDVAYKRFGFGGWINKKRGFEYNHYSVRSYTNQFSIGVAFLPERAPK